MNKDLLTQSHSHLVLILLLQYRYYSSLVVLKIEMIQMETVLSICHNLLVLITVFLHFLKALLRRDSETETYFSRPRHLSSETETETETFLSRPRRDRDFRNPVSRLSRDETSVSRLPSLVIATVSTVN